MRGASERALNLYRESLAMKSGGEQSSILNNIAMNHADRKEYSQAIGLLRQAIEIARSSDYKHQMAICQINLGYVLMGDKQYGAAGDELIAGLNFMKLVGDKHWQGVASEWLGKYAEVRDASPFSLSVAHSWYVTAARMYLETEEIENANRNTAKAVSLE